MSKEGKRDARGKEGERGKRTRGKREKREGGQENEDTKRKYAMALPIRASKRGSGVRWGRARTVVKGGGEKWTAKRGRGGATSHQHEK